ncbi:MAG: hypothetical protein ACYDBY_08030 [Thermoanaerobaculia bacterium]
MMRHVAPALGLGLLVAACGAPLGSSSTPSPSRPGSEAFQPVPPPRIAPAAAPTPTPDGRPLETLEAAGLPPVEMTAAAVEGFPPLPSYRAKVRNASDRPIRRVLATVVYLDDAGRPMSGESHEVAFGSPLKAIDPGVTLESVFLSRVDRAPGVRLVPRVVTLLEKVDGPEGAEREWKNPRYEEELRRDGRP